MLKTIRFIVLFYATAPFLGLAWAVLVALGLALANRDPYLASAAVVSGLLEAAVCWGLWRLLWRG